MIINALCHDPQGAAASTLTFPVYFLALARLYYHWLQHVELTKKKERKNKNMACQNCEASGCK